MRRVEHGPQRGAGPFRTRDFHAAAGLLRRHAQQGMPRPIFRVVRVVVKGSLTCSSSARDMRSRHPSP